MITIKKYKKKGITLIFYKENETESKCKFSIEGEEELTNTLLLTFRKKSLRVKDNDTSLYHASENIFSKIFNDQLQPYYIERPKKEKKDVSWAYNEDGSFNEKAIREKQLEMRKEQRENPTDIYLRKYQKINKRSFRPIKVKENSHGETGQVVKFYSKSGACYYGVGDSFVDAKMNLCKTLLEKKIDIKAI